MKLKFLVKLNALLLICSLFLSTASMRFENENERKRNIYEENDIFLEKKKEIKMNQGEIEHSKILLEAKAEKKTNLSKKEDPAKKVDAAKKEGPAKTDPAKKDDPAAAKKDAGKQAEFKFTITKAVNAALKTDKANLKKITQFKKCEIKTGVINYVATHDNVKNTIQILPTFVSLNSKSIELSENEDIKTLFYILELGKLTKIIESFTGTNCFSLIKKLEDGKEEIAFTLCGNTPEEKLDWIKAITDFKECDVKIEKVDMKDKVILDFSKINTLLKVEKKPEPLPEDQLVKLYYDNTVKVNAKPPVVESRDDQIKKEVEKILEKIRMGNLAQKQLQRKINCQISKAEKIKKDVDRQKEIVAKINEKRDEKDAENKNALLQKAAQNKELQVVKAIGDQILKLKKEEIKEKKIELKDELNAAQGKKIEQHLAELGVVVVEKERLRNYAACVDKEKLNKFKDTNYVQETCKKYFGESRFKECTSKTYFCNMCCDNNVGSDFKPKADECKAECKKITE